jgi:hypothetical protein
LQLRDIKCRSAGGRERIAHVRIRLNGFEQVTQPIVYLTAEVQHIFPQKKKRKKELPEIVVHRFELTHQQKKPPYNRFSNYLFTGGRTSTILCRNQPLVFFLPSPAKQKHRKSKNCNDIEQKTKKKNPKSPR